MSLDTFMSEYEKQLATAVEKFPDEYPWAHGNTVIRGNTGTAVLTRLTVGEVAAKMRAAIRTESFSHDGHAMRATCKALGIKATRKAILEFTRQ